MLKNVLVPLILVVVVVAVVAVEFFMLDEESCDLECDEEDET